MMTFDDAAAQAYGSALLVGERVRLRPLAEIDLPTLEAWWEDPAWMPLQQAMVRPRPAGSATETLRSWSANSSPGSVGFSIEALDVGTLAGHVTLYGAALPERAATLGIMVGPDHVGNGYGSDAVRLMLRYGFAEMGLNRVELRAWAFNDRALRAYERCGFVVEGRLRERVFHDGAFHDEVVMAVLARDWWQSQRP